MRRTGSSPDSRFYRKAAGREAKLSYSGPCHRGEPSRAGGGARAQQGHRHGRAARPRGDAGDQTQPPDRRITVGEDEAYDTADYVARLRADVTPAKSQPRRAMIECIFGWGKHHGTLRKTRHRGIRRVAGDFLLNLIAYNLVRMTGRSRCLGFPIQ